MCSNSGEALGSLEEALDGIAATVSAGAVGSGDRIGRLLAARARLDAVVYAEVAAFDTAGACVDDGAATTAGWLRAQHRLARRDASGLVHQARQLRDLPATSAALTAGRIGREHATAIIKAKTTTGLIGEDFDRFEAILVELAVAASPDEVRTAAAHLLDTQAPDRDAQLVEALAGRRFDLVEVGELVKVDAMIDKPTAETLLTAVEALSRRTPDDDRTWHQRRADAFSAIIESGVETGDLPRHGRTKPHLSIVMTLDQLTGTAAGPLLARFGRIPTTTAHRLACDAVLTRILTDPSGDVLDVGRAARHTTTAQNKALAAMYTTCGYPSCDSSLARCDIHHVSWWSNGGPTNLDNLLPLCKQHHRFVHEHGYTVTRQDPDGQPMRGRHRWRFLTPRGTPIPDHTSTLTATLHQLTLALTPPPPPVPIAEPATKPAPVPLAAPVPQRDFGLTPTPVTMPTPLTLPKPELVSSAPVTRPRPRPVPRPQQAPQPEPATTQHTISRAAPTAARNPERGRSP
jgi:uncharacterized protein DUF222